MIKIIDKTHFRMMLKRIIKKKINQRQKNSILHALRKIYEYTLKIFIKHYKISAIKGWGGDICLKYGFLPLAVHYYSPVPDINDLSRRNVWANKSKMSGIKFSEERQVELLKELGGQFSEECRWPEHQDLNSDEFYINNLSFSYGCAASTHCIIRKFKPKNLIEVGSGMSSRIIAKALEKNCNENKIESHYTIIDPYPGDTIINRKIKVDNIIQNRVETTNPVLFDSLEENDILFIDSGHCVKIGGDVNFLYLDVLPRVKKGVVVHIHDIALPYEYPEAYSKSETFRQFWTEQYLLQSFLCFNYDFEVLLGLNYLMTDRMPDFKIAFPFYDEKKHKFTSSSFWIRRKS